MKKVIIIGTVGVPAHYGGFETLVENIIGINASNNVEYSIFCSAKSYPELIKIYKGAKLHYVSLKANGIQSIFYDIISMLKTSDKYDVVLILGTSGCIFLPIFKLYYRHKIIVNIDGLEHRRKKWGRFARWFLRQSEKKAVKWADIIIADNIEIQKYVRDTYHKESVMIAYGGDHAIKDIPEEMQYMILCKYGVEKGNYAISVCRIEPENNCHIILDAFSKTDSILLFIGNWEKNNYGRNLKSKYINYPNIILCDPEYDLDILYCLRKNASIYVHGHSAGGTNPSLVEAMSIGCNILAYDVIYNRATTHNQAQYFSDTDDLVKNISFTPNNGDAMKRIAKKNYTWLHIAKQYEALY